MHNLLATSWHRPMLLKNSFTAVMVKEVLAEGAILSIQISVAAMGTLGGVLLGLAACSKELREWIFRKKN